jgi:hypothetical protein
MSEVYYVYAIVWQGMRLPPKIGDQRATGLTVVPFRELAAVVARRSADDSSLTIEAMLHHEAIVEAVRQLAPALPVRYGTTFRDRQSVVGALAERHEMLVADLEHLGDKVEFSLTALWGTSVAPAEPALSPVEAQVLAQQSAGAQYLRVRAAKLRHCDDLTARARAVSRKLDHLLGRHAIDRRVTLLPSERVALRASYLIDPADASVFRSVFDSTRRARREVRLLLTGPWPPYSFVRRSDDQQGTGDRRLGRLAHMLTRGDARTHAGSGYSASVDN